MADTKETQAQLDLQLQINQVLLERQALLKAQEKSLSGQVQIAIELCKALKCEGLDEMESRLKGITDALNETSNTAGGMGAAVQGAMNQGTNSAGLFGSAVKKSTDMMSSAKGAALGLGVGLVKGFASAIEIVTNLGSALGGILRGLGNLALSIIALPFDLLGGLIGLAQMGGGPSPILIELEKIRGQFGSLATNEGKAGASALRQFRKEASDLAGTGLRLRRVFGPGPDGYAKALAYNAELMTALGAAVGNFTSIIENSAPELAVYRKGLGFTAEQGAAMLKQFQAVGRDPVDAMREFGSMAINMGQQFGINSNLIGKDMAEMAADVANFGTLSVQELGQASVFARKLGIAVKELQGIIGKFENFEDAAQNSAKLAQSFGMNIDAIKMMNAANPAEQLSMLQKSFKETGRSVDQMTRAELKLLASQTGLSEEAAKLAFSQRGLSMSYDDIQKAGDKSNKKQLTQVEVMKRLADNIERVFGSGGSQFKSFFDAFVQGFSRGILRTKEFRDVMRAIRRSLREVFWAGVEVGKMFVKMFPGIKDMLKGLADLFSPERFGRLMDNVKAMFADFFSDLNTDPKAGVKKFIARFKAAFTEFFRSGGTGASEIMSGAKAFGTAIFEIFKALLPIAADGFVSIVETLTEILRSPPKFDSAVGEMLSKLADSISDLLVALWTRIQPSLKELFKVLFEKTSPFLIEAGKGLLEIVIGRMIIQGVASAITGAVTGFITKQIGALFGGAAVEGAASTGLMASIKGGFTKASAKIGELGARLAGVLPTGLTKGLTRVTSAIATWPVAIAIAIGSIGMSVSELADTLGPDLQQRFGKTAMQAGISVASIIDAITLGLLPDPAVKAIAEFGAKIYQSIEHFLIKDLGLDSVVETAKSYIDSFFNLFKGIGDVLSGIFSLDVEKVRKGFHEILDGIISSIQTSITDLPAMLMDLGLSILEGIIWGITQVVLWIATDGAKMFMNALFGLGTGLVGFGGFLVDVVVDGFGALFSAIKSFFTDESYRQDLWESAKNFGSDLIDGIVSRFSSFLEKTNKIFDDAWKSFKDYWQISSPSKLMGELGQALLDGVMGAFGIFPDDFLEVGKKAWDFIKDLFNSSSLEEFGGKIIDGIMTLVLDWPLRLLSVAMSAWSAISAYFSVDKLMALGSSIVEGIVIGLSALKDRVLESVSGAWTGVKEFFGWNSPATEGVGLGEGIVDGVSNGLSSLMPRMLEAFNSAFSLIIEGAQASIMSIIDSFTVGIQSISEIITSSGIIDSITDILEGIASTFVSSFTDAFTGVINAVSVGMTSLQAALQAAPLTADNLLTSISGIGAVFDMFSEFPDNIVSRIRGASNAFNEISEFMIRAGSDPGLATVIQLSNALTGDGRVTVEHENVQINVNITVKMSAEQVAAGILSINNTTNLPTKRFAVDTSRA